MKAKKSIDQFKIHFPSELFRGERNCKACHQETDCMGCCINCQRYDDCGNPYLCQEIKPQTDEEYKAAWLEMVRELQDKLYQ